MRTLNFVRNASIKRTGVIKVRKWDQRVSLMWCEVHILSEFHTRERNAKRSFDSLKFHSIICRQYVRKIFKEILNCWICFNASPTFIELIFLNFTKDQTKRLKAFGQGTSSFIKDSQHLCVCAKINNFWPWWISHDWVTRTWKAKRTISCSSLWMTVEFEIIKPSSQTGSHAVNFNERH